MIGDSSWEIDLEDMIYRCRIEVDGRAGNINDILAN